MTNIIKDLELYEISVVSIPMNPYALSKSVEDLLEVEEADEVAEESDEQNAESEVEEEKADENVEETSDDTVEESSNSEEIVSE
jgi:phage head maturation protease